MWDDIIYVGLLLVSIAFGKVTRQVQDKESRKWTSSIFGLIVVLVVSGWSTLHTLSSVILHTILIKFSPKSFVHWINFVFGFAYLIFFRSCGSIEVWFIKLGVLIFPKNDTLVWCHSVVFFIYLCRHNDFLLEYSFTVAYLVCKFSQVPNM